MCVPIRSIISISIFTNSDIQIIAVPVFAPQAYNYWAHLGLEIVTNIFWLSTFALLAEEAAGWDIVDAFGDLDAFLPAHWKSAIDATKAAAALGAFEWALFIVTLVSFGTITSRFSLNHLQDHELIK